MAKRARRTGRCSRYRCLVAATRRQYEWNSEEPGDPIHSVNARHVGARVHAGIAVVNPTVWCGRPRTNRATRTGRQTVGADRRSSAEPQEGHCTAQDRPVQSWPTRDGHQVATMPRRESRSVADRLGRSESGRWPCRAIRPRVAAAPLRTRRRARRSRCPHGHRAGCVTAAGQPTRCRRRSVASTLAAARPPTASRRRHR